MKRAPLILGALGVVVGLSGCGVAKGVVKEATPAAIDSGIGKMDDPATQRRIQAMVASPEMKAIEKQLVEGIVDGTLSTLSEKERADRIGALTAQYTEKLIVGAAKGIGPATEQIVGGAMKGAMSQASGRGEAIQSSVAGLVGASVRSAAEGLREAEIGKSVSSAMTEELGPAVQKVMQENIGPGVAEMLKNEEFNRALGATARVMGREMVLGATEGLTKSQENQPEGSKSPVASVTELAKQGAKFAGSAAGVLALIVVALAAWVVKLLVDSRRYRQQAERRAATALLVAEVTKASEGKPWSNELLESLENHFKDQEDALVPIKKARIARERQRQAAPVIDPPTSRPSMH